MERIRRGWRLTKQSWGVLRSHRTLALFPVLSGIFTLIMLAIVWGGGFLAIEGLTADDGEPAAADYVLAALSAYGAAVIAVYFNVALAGAADRVLAGEPASIGEGLRVANRRIPQILSWAALVVTVHYLLSALAERFQAVGSIISSIFGVVWAVATYLVVPVIALEGKGPIESIKSSASAIRAKWGEGLTGHTAIGGIGMLVGLAVAVAFGGALYLSINAEAPTAVSVALGLAGAAALLLIAVLFSSLSQIFRVALYRFATAGRTDGFAEGELQGAFSGGEEPRPGRI